MRNGTALLIVLLLPLSLEAQRVGRGTAQVEISGKSISIEYGRPQLRGRDMLQRAADGMVWRMGADQATKLVTEADLIFGNVEIAKGSYSLFARKVNSARWELLVNRDTGIWGTNHDPSKDIASIPLQIRNVSAPVEMFTIELKSNGPGTAAFSMAWGSLELSTPFQVQ